MEFNYRPEDVYVVNPAARLRNEGKYVIAGFPDGLAVPLVRLAPIEAVVVSLFDGKRTCAQVEDIASVMAHDSAQDRLQETKGVVNEIITKHRQPQGDGPVPLLKKMDELSDEQRSTLRTYTPTDYIVPIKQYDPYEMKLSFPVSLLLLLTNECQVKCQYCYMHKPPVAKKGLLPFERLRELMHEARDGGVMEIHPSGGDILCYPHFFEYLELMDELGFPPTSIPTKAYVSHEMALRLKQYRHMDNLQFSIDSTVPEIADYLTQSPGFCDRIMESIANAQRAGIEDIHIKTVITPYSLPTIPKLYRDFKAMGISKIILATYCRSGYHHQDKLFNNADDYEWLDTQIEKLKKEFSGDDIRYQNGAPQVEPKTKQEREERWPHRNACTAGRTQFTVCATGKVVACEQMPERDGDYCGDVRLQSIEEVWNGKQMDEYLIHPPREKFRGTACYDCDEYDECQTRYGVCVRDCCISFGTRWCPPPNCPKCPDPIPRSW